jgi:hypothetical protein
MHTPGPWKVENNRQHVYSVLGYDNFPIVWEMGGLNTLENARLIAAAPDLLEALKELLPLADEMSGNASKIIARADAAIKKAEGK